MAPDDQADGASLPEERAENGAEVPAPEVVQGPTTREGYAEEIREAYRETVKGIFRMGDLLIEAKEELAHGDFGPMVKEDLPFGPRTARMLMAVARDERLRHRKHVSDLPPSWGTLYKLSTLDDQQWKVVESHISPELTRSEIPELVARRSQLPLLSVDGGRTAREELEAALRKLPPDDRHWAKRKLWQGKVPLLTKVRVAKALAAVTQEERDRLIELDEVEAPSRDRPAADDLQLALPGIAAAEREELLEWDARHPRFGSRPAEGARSALALQSLLRWATALCDRTTPESVVAGLPMLRSGRKVARDARRVADWMTAMAEKIENEGKGGDG